MTWKQGDVIKVSVGRECHIRRLGADPSLHQGGEGFVVPLVEQPDTVVKIFHQYSTVDHDAIRGKHDKIWKMVRFYPLLQQQSPNVCWPKNLVYDAQGHFCGFTMRKANGGLLSKYDPRDKKGYRIITNKLLKILRNVLVTIQQTHTAIYNNGVPFILIGDIQPNNFMVDLETCQCDLIDADSFQIGNYRCNLNFHNYHSPERLINKEFKRDVYEEYYVVSYLLWEILTGGRVRPYQYKNGPTSPVQAVCEGFFALTQNPSVAHPLAVAYWKIFPDDVRELFYRNFHVSHPKNGDRTARPTVEEWQKCLNNWLATLESNS